MRRRSNLLVIIGVVTFVLGLVAVYVITSDDDDSVASASSSDTVEVLVASGALTAGTRGDDVVADGGVTTERINRVDLQPDALVTPSQLSNTVLTVNFSEGEQIRSSGLRSLGGPRAQIPEGFEAVAVDIELVAAGANTIIPGDRVNIFMVAPSLLTGVGTTADGETVTFPTATPRDRAAADEHPRARRPARSCAADGVRPGRDGNGGSAGADVGHAPRRAGRRHRGRREGHLRLDLQRPAAVPDPSSAR